MIILFELTGKLNKKQIYDRLKKASAQSHFQVYYGNQLPNKWRANNAQRFGPIVVIADPRYVFQDKYGSQKRYEKEFGIKGKIEIPKLEDSCLLNFVFS